MSWWRKAALAALFLALLAGIVLTWGSIGSVILMFGLLMGLAGVLYQRFWDREDSEWDMDQ